MATEITEWEFTADVARWINEILVRIHRLPFSGLNASSAAPAPLKRRDLTLFDKSRVKVLTGEVKTAVGRKTEAVLIIEAVVQDAREKAQTAGVNVLLHLERQ